MTEARRYTRSDLLLSRIGDGLHVLGGEGHAPPRPLPRVDAAPLAEPERRQAADLMRVNHAGEVAAQGLYHGQALFARDRAVRQHLLEAAQEERDHLQWCKARLAELGDGPSKLTPFWYAGSFAIGALTGLAGDQKSLGFVAETERQVSEHLADHLEKLPQTDTASRAVITEMKRDEERHGEEALAAGGATPPAPVRALMRVVAGVMKFGASRI